MEVLFHLLNLSKNRHRYRNVLLGVRVETEEDSLVDEGVLLLCPGTFLDFLASRANNGLGQASNVRIGDLGGREAESGKSTKP